MLERILVPLDGSRLAERALRPAMSLLKGESASLMLLHVIMPPLSFGGPAHWLVEQERRRAEKYLKGHATRLRKKGVKVECRMEEGEPARSLCRVAERENADLILMSSHGRSGPAAWPLGSIAERVVRTSRTPILLLPGERNRFRSFKRIAVPLEDFSAALPALSLAGEVGVSLRSDVTLLRFGAPRRDVARAVDVITRRGLRSRPVLQRGSTAHGVLTAARRTRADLLVVPTFADRAQARLTLGPAGEELIQTSDLPLLLVPCAVRSATGNTGS